MVQQILFESFFSKISCAVNNFRKKKVFFPKLKHRYCYIYYNFKKRKNRNSIILFNHMIDLVFNENKIKMILTYL